MTQRLRIAALISGGGRTLMNLTDQIDNGSLQASIELVISSNANAVGVHRARERGLHVKTTQRADFESDSAVHNAIDAWLDDADIDLICCCGYLRLFRMAPKWNERIMNIHPALLPKFGGKGMYGNRVHAAVIEAGDSISGCTVHFVDDIYDHGPTILQRTCPVLPIDDVRSLAARVFEQECIAYPQAIQLFAENRLRLEGDQVRILPAASASDEVHS